MVFDMDHNCKKMYNQTYKLNRYRFVWDLVNQLKGMKRWSIKPHQYM